MDAGRRAREARLPERRRPGGDGRGHRERLGHDLEQHDVRPPDDLQAHGGSYCDATHATWTASSTGGQENLPINCVNWYEAYAFCIWDGGFLPSEAEWEYAAAGGSEQRQYPWGTTAPGTMNQYAIYGSYYTGNSTGLAPVGTAAAGRGAGASSISRARSGSGTSTGSRPT